MMTLKKTHFNQETCVISPSWVSNGHWAIRKSLLANAPLFATVESARAFTGLKNCREMTDDQINRVMPTGDLLTWMVTRFLEERASITVRVLTAEGGRVAGIDVKYADLLGMTPGCVVKGKPDGAMVPTDDAEAMPWVLMPVRNGVDLSELLVAAVAA